MSTVFRRKKPHGYHLPLPETGVQSSELELTIAVATVAAAPMMAVSTPALMKITSLTWNQRKITRKWPNGAENRRAEDRDLWSCSWYHHLSLYIPEKLNFLSFITSFRGNKPDQSRHAGSAAASKIAQIIVPRTEIMNITSIYWNQVRISRPHRPEKCQPERREWSCNDQPWISPPFGTSEINKR